MKKILAVIIAGLLALTLLLSTPVKADNMQYSGNKYLLGDINGDGIVDMSDIALVASQFMMDRNQDYGFATNQYNPDADINKDGIIDMTDISIIARNFWQTSSWQLINRDWEMISQTQYWSEFILQHPWDANIVFDNKGHGYVYMQEDGVDWNSGGFHQGSKPFFDNSSFTYPFVPETKSMIIDCSAQIDHEEMIPWPFGSTKLRLDIWLHTQDQAGHTGEVVMTIDFDERGYGNLPIGASTYYEESHNGNTWLCYEYRLGSMNDLQWYNWTLNVNSYIAAMKAGIGNAPSSWQWVANALCSVRDIDMSMETLCLQRSCAAWIMDYCYFYAQG